MEFARLPGEFATVETASLFSRYLVRGASELVNLHGAVERLVLGVDECQLLWSKQSQGFRDVEHAQNVEEDWAIAVRCRRIYNHQFRDAWFKKCRINCQDSRSA